AWNPAWNLPRKCSLRLPNPGSAEVATMAASGTHQRATFSISKSFCEKCKRIAVLAVCVALTLVPTTPVLGQFSQQQEQQQREQQQREQRQREQRQRDQQQREQQEREQQQREQQEREQQRDRQQRE